MGETIDKDVFDEAVRDGWQEWTWVNMYGRDKGTSGKIFFRKWLSEDASLHPDGSRPLPFPGWAKPKENMNNKYRIVYDFEKLRIR